MARRKSNTRRRSFARRAATAVRRTVRHVARRRRRPSNFGGFPMARKAHSSRRRSVKVKVRRRGGGGGRAGLFGRGSAYIPQGAVPLAAGAAAAVGFNAVVMPRMLGNIKMFQGEYGPEIAAVLSAVAGWFVTRRWNKTAAMGWFAGSLAMPLGDRVAAFIAKTFPPTAAKTAGVKGLGEWTSAYDDVRGLGEYDPAALPPGTSDMNGLGDMQFNEELQGTEYDNAYAQ